MPEVDFQYDEAAAEGSRAVGMRAQMVRRNSVSFANNTDYMRGLL